MNIQTLSYRSTFARHADMESPELDDLLAAIDGTNNAPEVSDAFVLTALRFICKETAQPLGVDEVASAVRSSRRTLERHFRAEVGCTIREAITAAQLLRAKRLLTETTLPVIEVALSSGFSYSDRLGKVFARVEGMTPTQFREQAATSITGEGESRT